MNHFEELMDCLKNNFFDFKVAFWYILFVFWSEYVSAVRGVGILHLAYDRLTLFL